MFKGIPFSVKLFLRPMLLISLGLHTALLLMPLPSPPNRADRPKPKIIKIVKVPAFRPSPKPVSKTINQSQKPFSPKVAASLSPQKSIVQPKQVLATSPVNVQNKPDLKLFATPSGPPKLQDGAGDNLPTYPKNIQTPCEGVNGCVQTGDSFAEVTQYFEDTFLRKKITFSKEDTKNDSYDTEYRVYKVIVQKNKVQFLSLLSNGANTRYVWADKVASATDIVTKTEIPTDIGTFISQLPTQFNNESNAQLSPDRFPETDIKKFYIDPNPQNPVYKNTPADNPTVVSSNPINTYQTLSEKLSSSNYSAQVVQGGYGSGSLYEITKLSQTKPLYVTIIATRQQDGSIVALWLDMPR
jgi:hypothetical protein